MQISLKPFQDRFVFSKKKNPAFVGGWAVGKSMSLITRGMVYSQMIPDNLGIIFRKEYTDLRDSTVKDFEKYTGLKVNSQRECILPNKSTIMFRHIEELNNIQNVNLGWFGIEQGDELESDLEFFLLFGRLRRQVEPSEEFKSLGLPERSGFVIANAGDHWMRPLWKEGTLDDSELVEATTFDNKDVLPKDFLDGLETLKKTKPEIYSQFVLNDWTIGVDQFILIPSSLFEDLKSVQLFIPRTKRILSCDPATGGDECVIYIFENTKIVETKVLHLNDTMKIVGEIMILMNKHKLNDAVIDTIGIGKGIVDRLGELGKNVIPVNSAEKASDSDKFSNIRAEIWWRLLEKIQAREVEYPEDAELRKELSSVRYKVVNSNGKIALEPKLDTKKRLGRSPDRADAFVYGMYGLEYVNATVDGGYVRIKRPVFSGAGGW